MTVYHLVIYPLKINFECNLKKRGIETHQGLTLMDFAAKRKTDSILCCRQCKRIHTLEGEKGKTCS